MANDAEDWVESHQELLATVFLWRYNLRGEPLEIPAVYSRKSSRWASSERFQFSDGSAIVVYNETEWDFGIHASWYDDPFVFDVVYREDLDIDYTRASDLTIGRRNFDGCKFRNAKEE